MFSENTTSCPKITRSLDYRDCTYYVFQILPNSQISEFEKMSMDASKEVKEFREEVQNLKDAIKEKAQLVLEAEDTIYQQKEVVSRFFNFSKFNFFRTLSRS